MIIKTEEELQGIKTVSDAVAVTLRKMREYVQIGMSTKEIDEYGRKILENLGARSAPFETYNFPGYSCISVNEAFAHGVPSDQVILKNGDLINIDVSAELGGFWSDNGCSFLVGEDIHDLQHLVDTSRTILLERFQRSVAASIYPKLEDLLRIARKKKDTQSSTTWVVMALAGVYMKIRVQY